MSLGLYLHIPYCFSKCRYCDFYSAPGQRGVPTQYVDALLRELARFAPEAPLHPDTIYFGGGTPSLLSPADAARLIAAAAPAPGAEITLEANPETVTEQTLCGFREAGVNRISFGVQSARDSQLKTLGRPHTAKQARAAFAAARRAGFTNISGDIMLALPHYTQAEFDETLELIAEGGATHISAYLLKIEPDSAFGRHPPEGLPSPDEAADFYLYAVEHLEHHGYRQYEISNFAKPGYEGIFEETTALCGKPKKVANWLMGETLRLLKENGQEPEDLQFSPKHLASLIELAEAGSVNNQVAKEVFEQIFAEDVDPEAYVEEHGLKTVNDTGLLEETARKVLENNPGPVEQYKSGKTKVLGFLVGQVMKEMKGKANPAAAGELLQKLLSE